MEDLSKYFYHVIVRTHNKLQLSTNKEAVKHLGELSHISELAQLDIASALRYIQKQGEIKLIQPRMQTCIRDILKPGNIEHEKANLGVLQEYFPQYLPLGRAGRKVIYREYMVFYLQHAKTARAAAVLDVSKSAEDFFSKDLSFLIDTSAIKAPNPQVQMSFSQTLTAQLQEGLAEGSFSKAEISEYVLEHFQVDLRHSKVLEAILGGHYANEEDFFSHLASLVEISQRDSILLRILEVNFAPGQKALGFTRHFAFVSHSQIPTGAGPCQYIEVPPKMTVYVATVPGSLTTREECAQRVDHELLTKKVLRYSSVYRSGSKSPDYIMAFDSEEGYPLQRIEISFPPGEIQIVRRPCKYSTRFRLSDVIRQILVAYPHEWVDISILGCMGFEKQEQVRDDQTLLCDQSTMFQVPSSVGAIYLPLEFSSGDSGSCTSQQSLDELRALFMIDEQSAIFRSLMEMIERLSIEVGPEISQFHGKKDSLEGDEKAYEEYIEKQIALNPFHTRVRESTWLAVCSCLKYKNSCRNPITLLQQKEFCQTWGFNQAYLPLM